MRARGMITARAKAAKRPHLVEARGLERRRGLISFLTWAFFLAEVLGRDGIVSASAHASEPDEPAPAHGAEDAAPVTGDLSDRPMTNIGDQGEPTTIVSPGYTLNLHPPGREPAPLDMGDTATTDAHETRAMAHQSIDAGSAGTTGVSPSGLDAMPQGAESTEASLLHATIAPDELLHGVANTLGELPLVGGLLADTVHTVASTVENFVGGLGGLLLPPVTATDNAVLASGGSMAFEPASSTAPIHELETPHGFTDYGIALELSLPVSSALSLAPSSESDFASFSPEHDAAHLSIPTDDAFEDEAGLRASSDVLA